MDIPDTVALPLDLAKKRLALAGVDVEVEKTYPTKPSKGNGIWRVMRQTQSNGKVMLVVAEEVEGVTP